MGDFWHETDDKMRLWCREEGPEEAAVTVVLTHGYAQGSNCWHAQRDFLAAAGLRVLVWDLRGHGRSEHPADASGCTIDRIADDLAELVREDCQGPVVLVGHSMGGMALMALAQRSPELVRERVAGVGFIATSATGEGLGYLGVRRAAHLVLGVAEPVFQVFARHQSAMLRLRRVGLPLEAPVMWASCCGRGTSREDVRLTGQMGADAGFETMAAFLPDMVRHRRLGALAAYRGVPSLVLNGSWDLVVPPEASDVIAEALPGCRRVAVPGAGHNVMMAAPGCVSEELLRLATPESVSGLCQDE
ncbi:alpha/beta fold hydrolase [Luteococcus japonicus]|uniref:Putative hydrolase n=1 Tax=Luteococcus japonicus LSP_Lj1 TaxID=1255658 RepID=A0A1R4K8S0_9ACTN|nr:alpha/beta hydrolase [Luteococcus japonicus]SJN40720.1 putative hydrolase [Luteococcus japonicus LSP_Lj1]